MSVKVAKTPGEREFNAGALRKARRAWQIQLPRRSKNRTLLFNSEEWAVFPSWLVAKRRPRRTLVALGNVLGEWHLI